MQVGGDVHVSDALPSDCLVAAHSDMGTAVLCLNFSGGPFEAPPPAEAGENDTGQWQGAEPATNEAEGSEYAGGYCPMWRRGSDLGERVTAARKRDGKGEVL